MDKVGAKTLEVMSEAVWYNKWLLNLSEKYLGKTVLEIGSGVGNFTKILADKYSVTATDIDNTYLSILKRKFKNVSSGVGDLEKNKYFFRNQKFDTIICFNVLEHIKDDQTALGNAFKLLKTGGKMVIIVPAHQILFSKFDTNLGHFRRYSTKTLSDKASKAGFNIRSIRYINWISAIGWYVFMRIMKRPSMPAKEVGIFNKIAPAALWIENYIRLPFGLSVFCVAEK